MDSRNIHLEIIYLAKPTYAAIFILSFFIQSCEMLAKWKVSMLKIETEKGDPARKKSEKTEGNQILHKQLGLIEDPGLPDIYIYILNELYIQRADLSGHRFSY